VAGGGRRSRLAAALAVEQRRETDARRAGGQPRAEQRFEELGEVDRDGAAGRARLSPRPCTV
jgi:hypothetical protein